MKIAKEKTVAFTGHRKEKIIRENGDCNLLNVIATETYHEILSLCQKGYDTFLSGMSEGFDLIAAEAVLEAKKVFPNIRLIAVIPFKEQEKKYSYEDKKLYKAICEKASDIIFTSQAYHDKAFFDRNDFLVLNASYVLCYYIAGMRSGTMYTVNRASKADMEILNIRVLLSNYIYDDTPEKRELIKYSYMESLSVGKDKIVILKNTKDQIEIDYRQIKSVENVSACLCITLNNDVVYRLSTISDDVRMKYPAINPSLWTVIWWRILNLFHTLFRNK